MALREIPQLQLSRQTTNPDTILVQRTIARQSQAKRASSHPFLMGALEPRTMLSGAPGAPQQLHAAASSGAIQVQWKDISSRESGFRVYRGTSKDELAQIGTVGRNASNYRDSSAQKNKTYWYSVRAYNSAGVSGRPSPVSVKLTSGSSSGSGSGDSSGGSGDGSVPVPPPPPPPSPPDSPIDPPIDIPKDPFNGNVIYIGPDRAVKSLNSVHWPNKGDKPVKFLLDPSSTPYSVSHRFIYGNVTIEPADARHRPTIKLPPQFDSSGNGGDGTLRVVGSLTIRNINTVGGERAVLLGSSEGAKVVAENIRMTDGGAIWRGSGAASAIFHDNEVLGKPLMNVYSSFGGRVGTCVIDHSGTDVPVPQGGRMKNGQPVGETPIRVMNVDDLTLIGVTTKPWFYAPGKIYKQDIQIRPASKRVRLINCNFYIADVGDMAWRKPALPIESVEFINCTMNSLPHVTPGAKLVKLTNCTVHGQSVTTTLHA